MGRSPGAVGLGPDGECAPLRARASRLASSSGPVFHGAGCSVRRFCEAKSRATAKRSRSRIGGPTRTRTWDQWIHGLPAFPPGVDYLTTLAVASRDGGRVRDAQACHQGRSARYQENRTSPQVVSAPSDGVPPAWLRIAVVAQTDGFPEFIPFIFRLSPEAHHPRFASPRSSFR